MHLALNLRDFAGTPGDFQIVEILQIQPKLSIRAEIPRESQRGLRCDSPALVHDFTDAGCRYVQFERQPVDRQMERLHEILTQDFTRVDRRKQHFRFAHNPFASLVIIDNFYIVTMTVAPNETDSPLIVDPNRMLATSIASQSFQLISWWRS
jgi:hypothetical protein